MEATKVAGATIRTGVRVTSIDASAPAAVLDGGERVEGDIVIGAGGFGSLVREHVVDSNQVHGSPDARLAYKYVARNPFIEIQLMKFSFSIPLDVASSDPELKHLTETDAVCVDERPRLELLVC